MRQILFYFLLLFALTTLSCSGSRSTAGTSSGSSKRPPVTQKIKFIEKGKLQPILARAKAENKLVFLDFYTTWCLPCRVMDEEVFSKPMTARSINRNFISYKVNAEKDNGPNLATIFEVYAYPTLLFLDAEGNILERKDGSMSNSAFLNMAESALAKSL